MSDQSNLASRPIEFDEKYTYVRTSGAQFSLGVIATPEGKHRAILHIVNTQFRPIANGEGLDTAAQRRAVVSVEMSDIGVRGLHNLLGKYINQMDAEEEDEE